MRQKPGGGKPGSADEAEVVGGELGSADKAEAAGGLGPVCKVRDKGASLWERERERELSP